MSASGTARKALEAVHELGDRASGHAVSRKLGIEPGYGRLLCLNLAKEDYLDFKPSGLFKMTRKGNRTLDGKASAPGASPVTAASFRGRSKQSPTWQVARAGSRGRAAAASFPKPGQEPLCWHTVAVDGTGNSRAAGPGARAGKVLQEGTWPCGFCRGKGERPAGARCPVCHGTGLIHLSPPVARCAFCKGRGEEKVRSGVTCTVCRGKGYVEVAPSATVCAGCRGTGKEKNNKLPCLGCKGKGLVGERPAAPPKADAKPEDRLDFWQREQLRLKVKHPDRPGTRAPPVAATEREVLRAYCEAEDAGQAPNVPYRTRLTDGYVHMLRKKLCDKGLLASLGGRRYRTTDLGRQAVAPARWKEDRAHGS